MGNASRDGSRHITFKCRNRECGHQWKGEPGRIEDAPELTHHPHRYFAPCPACADEAPQAEWEQRLMKAWANATGPKSEAGKAASAANLKGHPTPEETKRLRFNAMKTGMYAETATYFPAKPGKYPQCQGCSVNWGWCATQTACVKQVELFMQHHVAFEQGNPTALKEQYASMQAAVFGLLSMIIQTIAGDGVKITSPKYYTNEGGMFLCEYSDPDTGERRVIHEITAHPLFKPLGELLSRNHLSLADMGITQAQAVPDSPMMAGRLAGDLGPEDVQQFALTQQKQLADLRDVMQRADAARRRDPIVIEHEAQNGTAA